MNRRLLRSVLSGLRHRGSADPAFEDKADLLRLVLSGLLQRGSADPGFDEKAAAEVGLIWYSSERVGGPRLRGKGGC
jgi:hypothetical protein